MRAYGVNELRKMYLEFFESKGHLALKSFSLVPKNDNSLLLINAGMAPLKPYFTGQEVPPRTRVTTCQKCIRTGDIENVGKTARHGTFFEMLGNFSFGDYFKHEAIAWSWEFLTEVIGLDPDRLYPSVYEDDDEAFEIWEKEIGIAPERIFRFGKEDNFWEHGAGPCGPCSEIYYDRGEKYGCGSPDCTVGCDCDRYMEVWNNVFTQFENDGHNHYTELENKNIDTGMGLERLAVVVQEVDSIFDVDSIKAIRDEICKVAGVTYGADHETDVSIRVITDHIRSATFMLSDGITPSNEGRGYVLRRLIRRAARHGRLLGIEGNFLATLSAEVIDGSKDGYPELEEKKEFIFNVLTNEENQFGKTIDQGLRILADMEEAMNAAGEKTLSGENAFKLYDTYGFPLDLTKEILEEKGYEIDEEGFKTAMDEQREKARSSREVTNYMGADATVYDQIDTSVTTEFVGYDHLSFESPVTVLTTEAEIVDSLMEGQKGTIIVEQTPFYATMGGQIGDCGIIRTNHGTFEVEETVKLRGGKYGHVGVMTTGMISVGEDVTLEVSTDARKSTEKNHSATHLLQKALKTILGSHVEQKGSLVTPTRLRFDFSHFAAMTAEELQKAEDLVNQEIQAQLEVRTDIMNIEDAKKSGAMALFGEKYGDVVRVVSVSDFSVEFCGGTHVDNTAKLGLFRIVSENSVASGVRRIEAVTGTGVLRLLDAAQLEMQQAAQALKLGNVSELAERCTSVMAELKEKDRALESLNQKISDAQIEAAFNNVNEVKGVKVISAMLNGVNPQMLRKMGDRIKAMDEPYIAVLAGVQDGKGSLLCACSKAAIAHGAHAGQIVQRVAAYTGGKGGGKAEQAMAGVGQTYMIDEALMAAENIIRNLISEG